MRGGRRIVVAALVAALLLSPMLAQRGKVSAAAEPEGAEQTRVLHLAAGEFKGTLVYSDGVSPVGHAPVRLWSISGEKFIQTVTTDAEGRFGLSDLGPGRYILVAGDRAAVQLAVDEDAEARRGAVVVVLPHGQGVFAQMAPPERAAALLAFSSEEEEEAGGGLLRTLLISGGTAVVVVTVADATDVIDEDDDDTIIVSQPG
jgi:hypothetical protein